jgi:hypothetical protein
MIVRSLMRLCLIITLGWATVGFAQEPPSVKLLTAPLVSPAAAFSFYGTSTGHTAGAAAPTTQPPEITELARALGAGRYTPAQYALTVYEYVRNNIATEFRFGLSKGARGALIDQSGTAFDQANLLLELFNAGGISTATYQVGTISLTTAQFQAWTGLADPATGSINAITACQFLADGAIPATVNGSSTCTGLTGALPSSGTPITLVHIWVAVNNQLYDPAYKIQVIKSGLDLAAQLNCGTAAAPTCGSTILTNVPAVQTGTGNVPFVQGVNQVALEQQLNTYARTLETNIRTFNSSNYATATPNMQVEDLIGGNLIDINQTLPAASAGVISELPSSAYPASSQYSWSGGIPDQYRTTLLVQIDNLNNGAGQMLFADETAGNRLRIWGIATNQTTASATRNLTLYSEYRPLATSVLPGATGAATLTLSVHHPYVANSGTYAAETLTRR